MSKQGEDSLGDNDVIKSVQSDLKALDTAGLIDAKDRAEFVLLGLLDDDS